MDIRSILKKSNTIVGLKKDIYSLGRILHLLKRKRIVERYWAANEIKKLQIGCNISFLEGWLCSDGVPISKDVIYLDATKKFPFDNETFDYVYSEHMIEHITWEEGSYMLQECWRILKPGGTIRITTPDLGVIIGLYGRNGETFNKEYIKWITENFLPRINVFLASFVINNMFRNWNHRFLYDRELLEMALQKAGFTSIKKYSSGMS